MIRETTAPADIKWLKIEEVYPYECNNKIHNQPEITKIANSIKEFGWTYPILIDENNIILAGHKRLLAAKQIGLTEVPTIRKDDLSDAQKRAYRIIDNKSSEESEYDPTNLTLELDEIKALDFDISKFITLNFNLDKIGETQDLDVQEDDYDAEPPAEPKTKYGDIYQLGNHRLMCGDSTKEEDVKKILNGNYINTVLTDPPYGIDAVKGNKIGGDKPFGKVHGNATKGICKANVYRPIIGDNTIETAKKNYELIKNFSDNQIIFGGNYFTEFLRPSKCWIVWDKQNSGSFADVELAWSSFDKVAKIYHYLWNGLCREGSRDLELTKRIHPTQKPVGLIINILKNFSDEDDKILDCFGGSGSTLIACEQLNRNCYMMELDPIYCDVIIDRWEKFTGRKAEKIN